MRPEDEIIDVASLDKLVPKTLDDVIREHRDHAEVRFANEGDLAPMLAVVPHDSDAQSIRSWSIVTLDWHPPGMKHEWQTVIFGDHTTKGASYRTSPVVKIDKSTWCVRTMSSTLYHLLGPESRDPDLFRICNWLWRTGAGKHLGVLPIFY